MPLAASGCASVVTESVAQERLTGQTDFVMVKDVTSNQAGLEALQRFSYRPMETEFNAWWRQIDPALAKLR